jgi:NAD(P)-dependent dehydrogenase (short-subunit alcohol dehydrogenase family)
MDDSFFKFMEEKVAIITGGSSGIGRASALALTTQGFKVLITGRRADRLAMVAAAHTEIKTVVADSAVPASAGQIVAAAIERWGRIDVLVNNVGAGAIATLDEVRIEQIENMLSLNVTAPSLLAQAALPYLRQSKGVIINVSSTFGHKPAAGLSHYGASKAALEYLTRSWALELAPDVRVNAIAPGPTESEAITEMMGLSEEQAEAVKAQEIQTIPLKRRGAPEDIGAWIAWLAGPASQWVTGQVIAVDGGLAIE